MERWFYVLRLRLRAVFLRKRVENELEEEFQLHLEQRIEEGMAGGLPAEEARHSALRAFENIARAKEDCRAVRRVRLVDQAGQNIRYAVRTLWKSPGFTAAAILTLMLGSGVTTALFSVVNGVILRPLPYREPSRIVVVWTDNRVRQIHEALVSYPTYEDWRSQARVFTELAISSKSSPVTLTSDGDTADRLEGAIASANLFSTLGAEPLLGRTFSLEEQRRDNPVVVLSYGLWQRRFAGADGVIGRTLELDGRANTVIGVMPSTFQFPSAGTQLWRPLPPNAARDRPIGMVLGRLKPQSTVAQAQTEMDFIGDSLSRQYPELVRNPDFQGFKTRVISLDQQIVGKPVRAALWVLLGAVSFVLLIACSNFANLLLARGAALRRELALRAALGASRSRIVGQVLTESLVLNLAGGVLGVALAEFVVRVLVAMAPPDLPRLDAISVNGRMLAFTLVLSTLTGIAFGLIPALQLSHGDPNDALKAGGRGLIGAARGIRTLHAMAAAEFVLALLLLCGAGLLLRSFVRLRETPLGFQAHNMLTFRVVLPSSRNDSQKADFYRDAIARLRGLPGVSAVGAISNLFSVSNPDATIVVEGRPETAHAGSQVMDDSITPAGFAALGVPLRRGRFFSARDDVHVSPVAIVNETFAQAYWANEDAVGKRFRFGDGRFDRRIDSGWVTIVGIVGDIRRSGLEQDPLPQVFLPMSQMPSRGTDLFVRTTGNPLNLTSVVRQAIGSLDRSVPLYRVSTLEQRLETSAAARKFQTLLLAFFAGIAVVLAAVGIYGVMHYAVTQRTQEMSIRLALGARRSDVLLLVLQGAAKLILAGLVIGIAAAWMLTRSMESLLYKVKATDPPTFLLAAVFLSCVALFAALRPALRAASVDPNVALRGE